MAYGREPSFDETRRWQDRMDDRVSQYLREHPEVEQSDRYSDFTFFRQVTPGSTRGEVRALLDEPDERTIDSALMAVLAGRNWTGLQAKAKEAWVYPGGWVLYFDDRGRGRDHTPGPAPGLLNPVRPPRAAIEATRRTHDRERSEPDQAHPARPARPRRRRAPRRGRIGARVLERGGNAVDAASRPPSTYGTFFFAPPIAIRVGKRGLEAGPDPGAAAAAGILSMAEISLTAAFSTVPGPEQEAIRRVLTETIEQIAQDEGTFARARVVFTESDERCGLTAELDGVKKEGVPLQIDLEQLEDAQTSAGARAQLKEALRLYFRRVRGQGRVRPGPPARPSPHLGGRPAQAKRSGASRARDAALLRRRVADVTPARRLIVNADDFGLTGGREPRHPGRPSAAAS